MLFSHAHAHALVIAAIFIPYMGGMGGLIAYACSTGKPRNDEPPDTGDDPAREPERTNVRLAA